MRLLSIALVCVSLSACDSGSTEDQNKAPAHALPNIAQTPNPDQVGSLPMFQLKYKVIFSTYITRKAYYVQNIGEAAENIKWIAINNREECLAVPIFNIDERTIRAMEVMPDGSDSEIAEFLLLEVGQDIPLNLTEECGEPIRLKVGTDRGEYDIGPLSFN